MPSHTPIMGNPVDPHPYKSDYADILKEAYKSYIGQMFQELVASIDGIDANDQVARNQAVAVFRRKVDLAGQVAMTAVQVMHE